MTADDSGVVFRGAIRLNGQALAVHGTMRAQGVRREGSLIFPSGVLLELGCYYGLTLNDDTRLEIVVDDLRDGQVLFTVLDGNHVLQRVQRGPGR